MRIEVFSHYMFDEHMKQMGLNDTNVDDSNMAFISIIGTKEFINHYLHEKETKHYFNDSHKNVLNLDFDDISTHVNYYGHLLKTMTMEQAEQTVEFIENMIEKNVEVFKIHCRAAFSRSRAVAEFIFRYCQEHNIDVEYDDRDEYITLYNQEVLRKLRHAYWKKHKLNCYANGEDYDNDLIDIPIFTINEYT